MEQSIPRGSSTISSQNNMDCDDSFKADNVSKLSELFTGDSLLELCNSFWTRSPSTKKDVQPYLRGCKWSPDGTCCLCVVNHDGFHIMELPRDLYDECPTRDRMITLLPAVIHVKESGIVYDFCWYPKMNSHYPETCSWISTKINSPIQMWDAYNGSLRCSYRGFNAVDEMEPAISVTFINEGQRIVGGYKNCLRTFDVERPGRDFLEHKIKSPASCFANHGNLLAVGSWNANIRLFSILDNGTYKSVGNLHAHTGGITHLQFTPDGTKLVSGARKDNSLCVWDVRYHRRPLNILKRSVSTNQRIYFDISPCGRYLVSGGTDGVVRVWDDKVTKWTEQYNVSRDDQENATFRFQLYRDCCNSVSIHPSRPILATGSGQFHFLDPVKVLESECDSGTNCDDGNTAIDSQAMRDSSSDQETEENYDDRKVDLSLQAHENTLRDLQVIDSTKDVTNKALDEYIAETAANKTNALKTSIDSSPENKAKCSKEINSIADEKINDKNTILVMPITENSNQEQIYEEPPSKKVKLNLNEATNKENNIGSVPNIDIVHKEVFEIAKDSQLQSIKDLATITQQDSNSQQDSTSESIVKFGCPSSKCTQLDEIQIVSVKEPNLDTKEEPHPNPELLPHKESNVLDETNSRVLSTEPMIVDKEKIGDIEKSPANISDAHSVKKPCNTRHEEDSAIESDNDSDNNENKMKYSSYVENNLTFWWIAKI